MLFINSFCSAAEIGSNLSASKTVSKPSPRCPSLIPSTAKPSHSKRADKSVGSCNSRTNIPASIACGVPAGTRIASPGLTGTIVSEASSAAESILLTMSWTTSFFILCAKPKPTFASAGASKIIQASVLP